MGKKYELLRLAFKTRGYTLAAVGKYILGGVTQPCVTSKLIGKAEWKLSECYKVLAALRLPTDMLPLLFPPNGVASVTDEQRNMIRYGRAL